MARVDDVAAAVLERTGRIDTFRLQKLVYYCQAWHLVWEDTPLFRAEIQAWANGPVVPLLYNRHRGQYSVDAWPQGDASSLNEDERTTVDAVVGFYGHRSGQELADLTHREEPWLKARARARLAPGQRGQVTISLGDMLEYYSSIAAKD
ncbi:MAG: DUF4065 domain-containing protein [Actinobacteria bacterium]|uniref:Unannotated protein n=1 Tax=freshwater metagenome TaxID=449393 RepID=A0A6J6F6K8_9ZZZZ|nr:DUF4065 domain-containing protein [Actinomycetota bacterium]